MHEVDCCADNCERPALFHLTTGTGTDPETARYTDASFCGQPHMIAYLASHDVLESFYEPLPDDDETTATLRDHQ